MNNKTPREADEWMYEHGHEIDERGKIARCIDKHGFDWGWDDDTLLGAADEVIAHLWQRADSYDFFDALEEWVQTNDNHEPEMIAKFTVEYLIGPKPEETK